jgi:hypothetical protein
MVVQMLFGKRDVLESYSLFATVELNKFIYPNPTHLPPILKLAAD